MRRYLILCDYLDSIDGVWLTSNIPKYSDMYTYYDYEMGIRNTTKPIFVYNFENPVSIDPAYELAEEIVGGKDELKRRPY